MSINPPIGKPLTHNDNGGPREVRGYCAALLDGKTDHKDSDDISSFREIVSTASISWIDYIIDDLESQAVQVASAMGFSELLVKSMLKSTRSSYEDSGDELGILLPAITVKGFNVKLNPLLILIRENLILTMHYAETKRLSRVRRYAESLLKKFTLEMSQRDRITLFLSRLIDENDARNFEYMREIEENGDLLSQQLADSKASRDQLGQKIYKMKHALINYLGGLWATIDTLNSLRYGDAPLISDDPKILNRISSELGEVNTQIGLAEHLSDVLASGLEVLQSIYNNQLQILNNKLAFVVAYLTIIGTALLVPNTIATIASNSAFAFTPADQGWYLTLLVVSTIVATWVAWWAVKRLGLLPKSPESPDIKDSKKR